MHNNFPNPNLLILYELGAETNIFDVYCSSSDLYFIVKSKVDFTYLLLKLWRHSEY